MGRPDIFTTEIVQICNVPEGRTAPEIGAQTKAAYGTVIGKLPKLVNAGKLHQAGPRKRYRYFKELAHAEVWAKTWAEEQKLKAAAVAARISGRPTDLLPKIKALCNVPCGRSLPELLKHTSATAGSIHNRLPRLVDAGEIYRAGKRRSFRYFTHQHHALAWDTKPDLAMLSALREAEEVPNPLDTAEEEPTEAAAPAEPTKRGRGKGVYGVGKAPHQDKLPAGGAVTWPANVRVTVAPTQHDTRFTFDPPPGWKGELGRDWERKRSGGIS